MEDDVLQRCEEGTCIAGHLHYRPGHRCRCSEIASRKSLEIAVVVALEKN